MNNSAMYKLSYGLFILTAKESEKDNGCVINTAMQVTDKPKQIMITVNKQNHTHDMIVNTGEFNISVLTESSEFNMYKNWGFQSGRDTDKTIGINFKRAENGIIYLTDHTNAYISGRVVSSVDLGTHTLFIAEVKEAEVLGEEESVTYSYYQKNIKPAPKKEESKKGFICSICGYIYEGDILPDDFICPLCKHGAEAFTKL